MERGRTEVDFYRRSWLERLLDYVYVPYCPGCGMPDFYGLCPDCLRCVRPQAVRLNGFCTLYAGGLYTGSLKKAILCCKSGRQTYLAEALCSYAARALPDWLCAENVLCVPMPADRKRRLRRGFHLPELIARRLCMRYKNWVLGTEVLKAVRPLKQQKTLTRRERFLNVRGAYEAAQCVRGEKIVLVDDVSTTGATIFEASKALFSAGAVSAYAVCAAVSEKDIL